MAPPAQPVYSVAGDVMAEELDGDLVVYEPHRGAVMAIGPGMQPLWAGLESGSSLAQLEAKLSGGEPNQDLVAFLDGLVSAGVVIRSEGQLVDPDQDETGQQ